MAESQQAATPDATFQPGERFSLQRARLLFVDFANGDLLSVAVTARVI